MLLCAPIMSLGAPAISVSHTAHKCLDLGIVFKFLILLHARCVLDWLHKKLVLVAMKVALAGSLLPEVKLSGALSVPPGLILVQL